jgi:hypothetical protein
MIMAPLFSLNLFPTCCVCTTKGNIGDSCYEAVI